MPFVAPDSIRRVSIGSGAGWGDLAGPANMIQWMLETERYAGTIEVIYTEDAAFRTRQLLGRLLIEYPQQLRLIAHEQFLQDFTEKRVPLITFSFFGHGDLETNQLNANVSIAFPPHPHLSTTMVTLSSLKQSRMTRVTRTLGVTSMGGIVPSADIFTAPPVSVQRQKPAVAQLLTAWDNVHTKAIYGCNVIFSGINMGHIVLNEVLALKQTQALEPGLWDKPIVICLLNILSAIDRREIAKAVTGEAFFISQDNPSFLDMLETHHKTGDVFILDVGILPKDIFEAITAHSTFPPSLEGAGQFRVVMDAQKPCVFITPMRDELSFGLPQTGEAAQQLLTASLAASAKNRKGLEDGAQQVEVLTNYYRALRDPDSAMSRYWQALFDQQQLAPSRYQVALDLVHEFVRSPRRFTSQNQTVSFSDPVSVKDTQKHSDFLTAFQQRSQTAISNSDMSRLLYAANVDFLKWLLKAYKSQVTPMSLLEKSLYWEIYQPETFAFIVKRAFRNVALSCDDMSLDVLNIALKNKNYLLTQWLLKRITAPLVEPRPFEGLIHAVYHQWPDVIEQLRTLGLQPASHHESDKSDARNPRLLPTPTLFPEHNYARALSVRPVDKGLLLPNERQTLCDAARGSEDCELHVELLSTSSNEALVTFCSDDENPQERFCYPSEARWQVMPPALTIRRVMVEDAPGWGDQSSAASMIQWMLDVEKFSGMIEVIYVKATEFRIHQVLSGLMQRYAKQLRLIEYTQFLQSRADGLIPLAERSFSAALGCQGWADKLYAKVCVGLSAHPNLQETRIHLQRLGEPQVEQTIEATAMHGLVPKRSVLTSPNPILFKSLQMTKPAVAQLIERWGQVFTKTKYGYHVKFSHLNIGANVLTEVLALKKLQKRDSRLHDKPIVICLMNEHSYLDKKAIAEAISGQAYLVSAENSRFGEMLERYHQTGQVFVLPVGAMPKEFFDAMTVHSTFPADLEGANQFRLVLDAKKLCAFLFPARGQTTLPYGLPEEHPGAKQLLNISSMISYPSSVTPQGKHLYAQTNQLAKFYEDARDPASSLSQYWKTVTKKYQRAASTYERALSVADSFEKQASIRQNTAHQPSKQAKLIDERLTNFTLFQQQVEPRELPIYVNEIIKVSSVDFFKEFMNQYAEKYSIEFVLKKAITIIALSYEGNYHTHNKLLIDFLIQEMTKSELKLDELTIEMLKYAAKNKNHDLMQLLISNIPVARAEQQTFYGFIDVINHGWGDVAEALRLLGFTIPLYYQDIFPSFTGASLSVNPRLLPAPTLLKTQIETPTLLLEDERLALCEAAQQDPDCTFSYLPLPRSHQEAIERLCQSDDATHSAFCTSKDLEVLPQLPFLEAPPVVVTWDFSSFIQFMPATLVTVVTTAMISTHDSPTNTQAQYSEVTAFVDPRLFLIAIVMCVGTLALLLSYANRCWKAPAQDSTPTQWGLFPAKQERAQSQQSPQVVTIEFTT